MTKGKRKSFVWRLILFAVISLVIGCSVYSWNARSLTGNQMPMPFGYGVSIILSGSMEPELSVNDLVLVKKAESYKVGDVIVYQTDNILVIHRICQIDGEMVTTKGDANNTSDEAVSVNAIKGKMIGSVPGLGMIAKAVKSPVGTILILALAILLLEMSWRKERSSDEEKLDVIRQEIERLKKEAE